MLESQMPLDIVLPARSSLHPQGYLEQIRQRLAKGSDLRITADTLHEPHAHAGTTHTAITDADLVVLTTHHNGFARFWLVDITNALVRWMPAPILALRWPWAAPDSDSPLTFQRMLIPLDGSALAEQILAPAVALGSAMGAEYTLLYVVEPYRFVNDDPVPYAFRLDDAAIAHEQAEAQDYLDGIALLMRAEGLPVQTQVAVARDARTAIRQAARQHEIDVIAMATHARGGLNRLLLGSVAVQVLHDSKVPVLLYRPQERRRRAGYE